MKMVEKFMDDIKVAMKSGDKETLSVLRMAKGSLDKERIDKKREVNDELLTEVIAKEIKTRNESIKEFEKGGRTDLVEKTQNEVEVLKKYLPEQLSEEEVDKIIEEAFNEVKAESMKDMGKVMGLVTPKVKGRFDMSTVSAKIKAKLS
ncbi:MAG: GatB/YqeY domain-containing protein [Bacilli bacterium]|nr:GatB/YqeY domain-containing protein [Bacilli bacterium]